MALMEYSGTLSRALKELKGRWDQAKDSWSDAQSREFEKVYIEQLEQDVRSTLGALSHMDETLQKIKSDCS